MYIIVMTTIINKIIRKDDCMKVFVVGAAGRVGQATVKKLVENGHTVSAADIRIDAITEADNVKAVKFDLLDSASYLSKAIKGHDAVIFTAGSSREEEMLRIDAFGVVKTAEAAKLADVSRFILLSAKWAMYPGLWTQKEIKDSIEKSHDFYIAKYFANTHIMRDNDLQFTIIEPDIIKDTPGTGKIELNNMQAVGTSVEDVAEVLASCIDSEKSVGKIYTINNGETPISEAINNLSGMH